MCFALVLALLLPGCRRPEPPPSLVIALIDTLRADGLGAYGGPPTPHLDALAAESVLFEDATAPAPWTLPSVASLFTSRLVCEHRVAADGDVLAQEIPTLAERLRPANYATAVFFSNPYVSVHTGLARGFGVTQFAFENTQSDIDIWLDQRDERPFFLYVHSVEPHDPYEELPRQAGEAERAALESLNRDIHAYRELTRTDFAAGRPLGTTDNTDAQQRAMASLAARRELILRAYREQVVLADQNLGALVASLRERDLLDRTVLMVVSDHGEEFGEHEGWMHDQSLYQELVHVPFLMRLPGGAHGGQRVTTPVSLMDVLPTLAEALGLPQLAADARGRSLLPLIGAEAAPEPRVVAARLNHKKFYRPDHERRGDRNLAIRSGRWKGIWNLDGDRLELYDLEADPAESQDLALQQPEQVASLRRAGAEAAEVCRRVPRATPGVRSGRGEYDPDIQLRDSLRALGYLTEESEEPTGQDPPPR
jgi:arylsulfatase A-like enzyme